MWKGWILILCVAGTTSALLKPRSYSVNVPSKNRTRKSNEKEAILRFACPVGFFRLRRYCYYLSAGTASWRDAHFHCKDRNSTLAILDRNGKDRILRRYLMGDQFTKLERWIGGIYNWAQMAWEWGVSGEKVVFQSFSKLKSGNPKQYAWHCIVMNPALKYKWSPKSCVEPKHYICEVPAGRIGKRRKKLADAPQNQRLKPRKKGKKYTASALRRYKQNQAQPAWRREWVQHNQPNEEWIHGVKLGSRPPSSTRWAPGARPSDRMRHRNKTHPGLAIPRVSQIIPQGREYGAFLGDGPANSHNQLHSLTNTDNALPQFHSQINDFSLEEVLLKT